MSATQAYPLAWPTGWPRTPFPGANERFKAVTVFQAVSEVMLELKRLGIAESAIVISSNVTLASTAPKDKGVCVYFTMKGKPYALPCDKWSKVEHNLWALAKHIESIRGQERWGVGTVERHFAGYVALMGGREVRQWWDVLNVTRSTSSDEFVRDAYKNLAKRNHPDAGGSVEAMAEINEAFASFKKERGLT